MSELSAAAVEDGAGSLTGEETMAGETGGDWLAANGGRSLAQPRKLVSWQRMFVDNEFSLRAKECSVGER
ncbi:MAG TPA: hypothetical protein VEA63_07090, partial [Opitutus sp.]|nr:hypothetical protein [Opitutus sp.]